MWVGQQFMPSEPQPALSHCLRGVHFQHAENHPMASCSSMSRQAILRHRKANEYKDMWLRHESHPASERRKLWRAASKVGQPGGPKSRVKMSSSPPSAVSPSADRDSQSGTTCRFESENESSYP